MQLVTPCPVQHPDPNFRPAQCGRCRNRTRVTLPIVCPIYALSNCRVAMTIARIKPYGSCTVLLSRDGGWVRENSRDARRFSGAHASESREGKATRARCGGVWCGHPPGATLPSHLDPGVNRAHFRGDLARGPLGGRPAPPAGLITWQIIIGSLIACAPGAGAPLGLPRVGRCRHCRKRKWG